MNLASASSEGCCSSVIRALTSSSVKSEVAECRPSVWKTISFRAAEASFRVWRMRQAEVAVQYGSGADRSERVNTNLDGPGDEGHLF